MNTGLATGRRAHPLRAMHRQAAAFARGEVLTGEERESSHRDPSIFSSSTAQPLASTSARIDLLTVDGSAARVYLGPALVESSSNPHRHGAVQEHARRSRSRAGNEDRWPVAGSEIHAACRGPAAQPATTALPRSHRGTARWGWRCTSEPGRRTNVDVEARCDEAGTARPSWRRGRRRHHEDTTGGSDVKPMPPPRRRRGMRRRQNGSRCCDAGPGYHKTPLRRRPKEPDRVLACELVHGHELKCTRIANEKISRLQWHARIRCVRACATMRRLFIIVDLYIGSTAGAVAAPLSSSTPN